MNSVLFSGQPVEGSHVNSDQSSGSVNTIVQSNPGVEHGATSQGTLGFHRSDAANKRQQIVSGDSKSWSLQAHCCNMASMLEAWQFRQLRRSVFGSLALCSC